MHDEAVRGSSSTFADSCLSGMEDRAGFEPHAFHNREGDCVEWYFMPDSFHAERIDDLVTVFVSRETDEPVGAMIKNVRKFVDEIQESAPGFKRECRGEGIKIEYLLTAGLWRRGDTEEDAVAIYFHLREVADKSDVRVDLAAC